MAFLTHVACTNGYKVTQVDFKKKENTTRTIYAAWKWDINNLVDRGYDVSPLGRTHHFNVEWFYATADDFRFEGTKEYYVYRQGHEDEVPLIHNSSGQWQNEYVYEWTAPEEAIYVKVRITPISATDGNGTAYYSNWSPTSDDNWTIYIRPTITISAPPAPTVEISGSTLTAKVDTSQNKNTEYQVHMQVRRDDGTETPYKETTFLAITYTSTVTYKFENVADGYTYQVRAQYYDPSNYTYGEWSDWSAEIESLPIAPIIRSIEAVGDFSIYLTWSKVNNIKKYTIQAISKNHIEEIIKNTPDLYSFPDDLTLVFESSNFNILQTSIDEEQFSDAIDTTDTSWGYTWNLNTNEGGEYYIRVMAQNKDGKFSKGSETKISTGSISRQSSLWYFNIGTKPEAPTTWSSVTTAVTGEPVTLFWQHNSADNSKVQLSVLDLTFSGGNHFTFEIESDEFNPGELFSWISAPAFDKYKDTVRSATIDTSTFSGTKITWKVKTGGAKLHPEGEPLLSEDWSVERTIDIYDTPSVSVSLPSTVVNGRPGGINRQKYLKQFPLTINATVGNHTNQSIVSYHVNITVDSDSDGYYTMNNIGETVYVAPGSVVYSKHFDISSDELTIDLTPGDLDLANNTYYNVLVTVAFSSGITVNATNNFTVSWTEDLNNILPSCSVSFNKDDYSATITSFLLSTEDVDLDNYRFSVYRKEFNGEYTEIAKDVYHNTPVIDPHPSLNYARYRVVVTQLTTGAAAYTDTDNLYFGEKSIIIQWDETWQSFEQYNAVQRFGGSMVKLPYNIVVSDNFSKDATLVNYIGRDRPVSYYGTIKSHISSWNVDIPRSDSETLYAIRRLAEWMGDVYVREPSGTGYWANISVSYTRSYSSLTIPVTLTITRVEGGK